MAFEMSLARQSTDSVVDEFTPRIDPKAGPRSLGGLGASPQNGGQSTMAIGIL